MYGTQALKGGITMLLTENQYVIIHVKRGHILSPVHYTV